MNGRRPLSRRQQLQMMILFTILAWATTTLLHQWGYGQTDLAASADMTAGDKFVPGNRAGSGAILELRGEATVIGDAMTLKQICRWSDGDNVQFKSLEELTVAHFAAGSSRQLVTVEQLRQTLHEAGVNVAMIEFAGQASCTVTRGDMVNDPRTAMRNWIDGQQRGSTTQPSAALETATRPDEKSNGIDKSSTRLRDLLTNDICQRLQLSADEIQMAFNPEDEKVLNLAEPLFRFDIKPLRARGLGSVSWEVTVIGDGGSKSITLSAIARAWEDQVTVTKPIAFKQVLEAEDFSTRRVLVDSLPEQPLLKLDQCIGQAAASDLHVGTIMMSRLVDPVPLVRSGQLVTVMLTQGSVQIRTVARAMEQGTNGQSIKVKNESTRDVYDVTVTGPQEVRLISSAGVNP